MRPPERQRTAGGLSCVRADAGSTVSTRDVQLAAPDGEHTHACGTDARFGGVAVVDDERAGTEDGQEVAGGQLDALRGTERGTLAEIQGRASHVIAIDGDTLIDGHILIDLIGLCSQCGC